MLTAIRQPDNQKAGAWEAEKNEGPYLCFCCRQMVILRKGGIKAPHFAHQPPATCEYGTGESEEHRRCKIAIYEALRSHPRVTKCEMERDLGSVRPDVSAYINRVPVAIEVQVSNLSLARIRYRTEEYTRRGIYALWLPVYTAGLRRELISPRPWERWLHAAYFGRVYYWTEGLKIQPIHFRDYLMTVKGRTHDYTTLSRRKVPIRGEPAILTENFIPVERDAWTRDYISIPRAKLFMDQQPDWYR